MQLIPDEELERNCPHASRHRRSDAHRRHESHRAREAVRGTAENPMTREEVVAKARDLMTPVLGAERCEKLIQTVFQLGKPESVRDLRPLLQRV